VFEELNDILSQTDKKKLFVGIGNLLKKDDGIGAYISERIISRENIQSITVEVSIENYIGKINSINPDLLILVDCMDMKSGPGTFKIMTISHVQDITFNTHNISLKRICEFFQMPVYIMGIQPEKVDFGENISYLVKKVADEIIQTINIQEVKNGY
jgi:hydrogenase 3 maturation protease